MVSNREFKRYKKNVSNVHIANSEMKERLRRLEWQVKDQANKLEELNERNNDLIKGGYELQCALEILIASVDIKQFNELLVHPNGVVRDTAVRIRLRGKR